MEVKKKDGTIYHSVSKDMYFGFMLSLMFYLVGIFSPELCGLERSGGECEDEEDAC